MVEDIPFSALALERAPRPQVPEPPASAVIPWWLNPLVLLCLAPVLAYRAFVPVTWRRRCIYVPTCSEYAVRALQKHGAIRGVRAILSRLRRCNALTHRGGADPP